MSKQELLVWVFIALVLRIISLLWEDYTTVDISDIFSFGSLVMIVALMVRIAFFWKH
jgi:hypothetical protein